jgi:hypothetical protein
MNKNKTTCIEKYNKYRNQIRHGDIILFRGNSLLSKTIQYFDNAYYNHTEVALEVNSRLLCIGSNRSGVKPDFLSNKIAEYVDFCVLRLLVPDLHIALGLYKSIERGEIRTFYDFLLLPRIALVKKTGINISSLGSKDRDICSEFSRYYANAAGVDCYNNIELITPQDFVRFANTDKVSLLFND